MTSVSTDPESRVISCDDNGASNSENVCVWHDELKKKNKNAIWPFKKNLLWSTSFKDYILIKYYSKKNINAKEKCFNLF